MNALHESLILSIIEAVQFAGRCAYETIGEREVNAVYVDIHRRLTDLVHEAVVLGGEL